MTEQDQMKMIRLFNEGFEKVVLPHIEALHTDIQALKETTKRLEETTEQLKETTEQLKETTERIEQRQIGEQHMLDNHDVRIKKLEKAVFPSS